MATALEYQIVTLLFAHWKLDGRSQQGSPVLVPADRDLIPDAGVHNSDPFFVRYYADDAMLVEIVQWLGYRQSLRAAQSLALDHFRLLGERGNQAPPVVVRTEVSDWNSSVEVLEWTLDSEAMAFSMFETKARKLQARVWTGRHHGNTPPSEK